jgi:hypothetical protein
MPARRYVAAIAFSLSVFIGSPYDLKTGLPNPTIDTA